MVCSNVTAIKKTFFSVCRLLNPINLNMFSGSLGYLLDKTFTKYENEKYYNLFSFSGFFKTYFDFLAT